MAVAHLQRAAADVRCRNVKLEVVVRQSSRGSQGNRTEAEAAKVLRLHIVEVLPRSVEELDLHPRGLIRRENVWSSLRDIVDDEIVGGRGVVFSVCGLITAACRCQKQGTYQREAGH